MAPITETQVEDHLVHLVARAGGIALKFASPGRAGGPDRIVLWSDGAVEWVELKKPKGRFRALQPIFHALLRTYRQRVETLYTIAAVEAYVLENPHALRELLPKELC